MGIIRERLSLKELSDTLITEKSEIAGKYRGIFKKIIFKLGQKKFLKQKINKLTTKEIAIKMLKKW